MKKVIVKSVHSEKYRQTNNTWAPGAETARRFSFEEPTLNWYKNYPEYYELVEVDL